MPAEKRVLLLNTNHNNLGLIKGLKKLGYTIIATGLPSGCVGEKFCDKYVAADYTDRKRILEIIKEEHIDRICGSCNDHAMLTAAYVAEKLGWPGYDSYDTTELLFNKDRFKDLCEKLGIIAPWTRRFTSKEDALKFIDDAQMPVIVKPVDSSGGIGVSIVRDKSKAAEALDYALEKSRAKRLIVEQYLEGTQHGMCTFIVDQKVRAICSDDEYSIATPYQTDIDTYPSERFSEFRDIVKAEIEKISEYLKLSDGIFHVQLIMKDGVPYILEPMRRAIGNMYSVPADMLTEMQWDYWEARALTGESCKEFPGDIKQQGFFAYKVIKSAHNGIIKDIVIPKEYEKYVVSKIILRNKGEEIHNHPFEHIGILFFMFKSFKEMKDVLITNYRYDLVVIE